MLSQGAIARDIKLVRTCSIWRALNDVGDLPSLLILQSIWMGRIHFGEINKVAGLPKAVLSNRLKKLRDAEILAKPASGSSSYTLTSKGLDLFWVVLMLLRWESRWSQTGTGPQVSLFHRTTGEKVSPQPLCAHCRNPFSARDVEWRPGPGIGLVRPIYSRRRHTKDKLRHKDVTLLFTESAEILGDRWSALIIRSILTGLTFFDQILDDTGIANSVLSMRLKWLRDIDMITSDKGSSGAYQLTEKGEDFFPVLVMLQSWGDKHYATPEGPPVQFYHAACTHNLMPVVTIEGSEEAIELSDISMSFDTDPTP